MSTWSLQISPPICFGLQLEGEYIPVWQLGSPSLCSVVLAHPSCPDILFSDLDYSLYDGNLWQVFLKMFIIILIIYIKISGAALMLVMWDHTLGVT